MGSGRALFGVIVLSILAPGLVLATSEEDAAAEVVAALLTTARQEQWAGEDDIRPELVEPVVALGEAAVQPLVEGLGDGDWSVRGAAAHALGRIGPAAGDPWLPC